MRRGETTKTAWMAMALLGSALNACAWLNTRELEGEAAATEIRSWLKDADAAILEARAFSRCTGFPCDPSLYYRFVTTDGTIERLLAGGRLRRHEIDDAECEAFTRSHPNAPPPSWWKPLGQPGQPCYYGAEPPNHLYLLYDSGTRTAFFFVQNT
jgi:hypothetical protein